MVDSSSAAAAKGHGDPAPSGSPDFSSLKGTVGRFHGWEPVRVEGTLPAGLEATFIRTGPGVLDRFGRRIDHAFMADGVMVGLRIRDGRADSAVRVVATPEYVDEERAGKPLFGSFAPRWRRWLNGLQGRSKATGNTALLRWQDRTFALMEGDGPVEIDAETLATVRKTDLGGVVKGPFSAHPHRIDDLGTVFNFGQRYGREPHLELFALPDQGRARRLGRVDVPWNGMVHDFAVTPNYAVFIICPLKVNVVKALLGLGGFNGLFQYDASEDAEVIVVPWSDVEHPIRIPVAPRFIFHFANAHDEDGELTIDFVQYPNADVVTALSGNDEKTGPLRMRLQRMRIDVPRRRVLSDEILWNHTCEFPWVPPQQVGHRYDTLWLVAREKGHGQGIVRLSPDDGTVDHWLPGEGIRSSEPMFVPRPGGSVGQGWLVCLCLDGYAKKSFFAVLDASRPSDGPVAKLWLDQPLHSTYHGIVIEGL